MQKIADVQKINELKAFSLSDTLFIAVPIF